MGIIVGGIILGIAETTTGFYISTGYKDVPGLVLLLIVLAVRPQGLFGKNIYQKGLNHQRTNLRFPSSRSRR